MRYLLIVMLLLLGPVTAVLAAGQRPGQVSVSIGINVPAYPHLVLVPGYPVYYDPQVSLNLFFYDGLYWVFHGDNWYVSSWYNGPWDRVDRYDVPLYVLRVPVRYYRQPPAYFHGWRPDAPPRWGEHWGRDWEQRRSGWDRWDRGSEPAPAPLPTYQRQYSGDRYPRAVEQQQTIRSEQYRYQPREPVTQQRFQQRGRQQDLQQRQQEQQRPQPKAQERGRKGKDEEQEQDRKKKDEERGQDH